MKKFFFLSFFILSTFSFAQQQYFDLQNYNTDSGLPNNRVNIIYQDFNGFIWIGTDNGLCRFDGYECKTFLKQTNAAQKVRILSLYESKNFKEKLFIGTNEGLKVYDFKTSMFDTLHWNLGELSAIFSIAADTQGRLYLGNINSLVELNPHKKYLKIHRVLNSTADSLGCGQINKLFIDSKGNLWIGGRTGLWLFNRKNQKFINFSAKAPSLNTSIHDIKEDPNGNLWIATGRNGLQKFILEQHTCLSYKRPFPKKPFLNMLNMLSSLQFDQFGCLWLGSRGSGLSRFYPSNKKFQDYFTDLDKPISLKGRSINALLRDRSNVLWVGTENSGLYRFKIESSEIFHYKHVPENKKSLGAGGATCFYADHKKNLWVGTRTDGLNLWDKTNKRFIHFRYKPGKPYGIGSNRISAIIGDQNDNLWIATLNKGINYFDKATNRFYPFIHHPQNPNSLSSNSIFSLLIDKENMLWIGTLRKGIDRYNPKKKRFSHYLNFKRKKVPVFCLYEDAFGELWAGSNTLGVLKYNPQKDRFIPFNELNDQHGLFRFKLISAIQRQNKNILWIGTAKGLLRFDLVSKTFHLFSEMDNLPSNGIRSLAEDNNGFLWITTVNGLAVMDLETQKIHKRPLYATVDDQKFFIASGMKSNLGSIYFGNYSGFICIDPHEQHQYPPPAIAITQLKVYAESSLKAPEISEIYLSSDASYKMDYGKYAFLIEFSVLDFSAPNKNRYAYMLEESDQKWHALGKHHEITLVNLPAGKHTIHIKGSNGNGVWNEQGLSVTFNILPPFWQTWSFRIFSALAFIFLILLIFSLRMQSVKKRNRELQEINLKLNDQITIRKNIERMLRESEVKYRTLMESVKESVFSLTLNGQILFVNSTAAQRAHKRTTDLVGHYVKEFLPEENLKHLQTQISQVIKSGEGISLKASLQQNERLHHYQLSIQPVREANGQISQALCIATDITNQVELEEQLRQSQKMEAIGKLAGGIAHDFNNLLSIIRGYSYLLLSNMSESDPSYESINEIDQAGERAQSLTRQLLAFSRKQLLQPKVMDLNKQLLQMEKMLQRLIGEHIFIKTHFSEGLHHIFADPGQIEQVVMNLVVNAGDAMPKGGKLIIETKNITQDNNLNLLTGGEKAESYVMLTVSDTGSGIPKALQEKIFDPFFTTKPKGKGTGLGLSTVFGIVKQSDGYIWVESRPGKGTTFKIYFPAVDKALSHEEEDDAKEKQNLRGSETILVVEDERGVRNMVCKMLRLYGYRALEAKNARQAQALFAEGKGHIDLILTDIVMPGLSGVELVERLAERNGPLKVVYMSGYTEEKIVRHGILNRGIPFIQKPFTPETIIKKIRTLLD